MTTLGERANIKCALANDTHTVVIELAFPISEFLEISPSGLVSRQFWSNLCLGVPQLLKVTLGMRSSIILNLVLK